MCAFRKLPRPDRHKAKDASISLVEGKGTIIAAGATAIALTDRPHAYSNPKSPARFFMTVDEPATAP